MQLRLNNPLILAVCLLLPTPVFGQFTELTGRVHKGANTVVGIDATALKATELAQKNGWTKKLEAAYVDRAIFLPPEAEKLLITSQIAPGNDFQEAWELALMKLSEPVKMTDVARAEGGYVDQINGKEIVWTPSNAYVVALEPQMVGVIYPAQRQAVANWIDEAAKNSANGLSEYLELALAKITAQTPIVMAVDLRNMVDPHLAEQRWAASETIEKTTLKVEDVVAMLTSLRGATLELTIDSSVHAKSRIDFEKPITLSDANAKRLVLEALQRLGSQIDDFADHKYSVVGKSIFIEGEISKGGLRRLLSVVEVPTTKFSELEEESVNSDKAPSAGDMAENSQTYFKSVTTLLDDLRGDRKKQDTRGGYDAVWLERYARKIDRLPILYVDEDLLDYGAKTAETLRYMAGKRKDAGLTAGVRKSSLPTAGGWENGTYSNYAYGYRGAGYGYRAGYAYGTGTVGVPQPDRGGETQRAMTQIERQEQNRATSVREEGWRLIDNATAEIRREMTQRYSVEF
ncbi:MAG: hypothetical protein KDA52_13565 [Planctomycetaceae bacterium]|nr:hypothetical protein [Planctomycetaceae bacterium]